MHAEQRADQRSLSAPARTGSRTEIATLWTYIDRDKECFYSSQRVLNDMGKCNDHRRQTIRF